MASSKPKSDAPAIDPAALYLVTLTRAVRIGKNGDTVLTPRDVDIRMRGDQVIALGDAIATFEKIAEPVAE